MTDPRGQLADLLADVLAVAQDAAQRGVEYEGPSERLPPPLTPEPAHGDAWSSLASKARESAEVASVSGDAGLAAIRQDLGDCRRCRLCTDRNKLAFGVGPASARLMVLGHAPERPDDLRGEPFVGPSGDMLDKMLKHVVGVPRDQAYITTAVKCRPANDRNPELDEVQACHPFLMRQIRAVSPSVILVMGETAFQILFRTNAKLARGEWRDFGGIPVMATFHPSHLATSPDDKRLAMEDLKAVKQRLSS